jgi:hypothetical protein
MRFAAAAPRQEILQQRLPKPCLPYAMVACQFMRRITPLVALDRCPHCNRPLPFDHDVRQVFCSYECCRAAYWLLISQQRALARAGKICRHCGRKFDAKNLSKQVFCSRHCVNAHHNRLRSERTAAMRAGKTCKICGVLFDAVRTHQERCPKCRNRRENKDKVRTQKVIVDTPSTGCVDRLKQITALRIPCRRQ